MLLNEAFAIACLLDNFAPATLLDIGSGGRADREISQPHIYAAFRGHRVIWTDKLEMPGQLRCDICQRASLRDLPWCDMVTCCSVLEHVIDIDAALDNLQAIAKKWLLVSVPHVYPEHHCPIDNLWRPSPDELGARLAAHGGHVLASHLSEPETFYGIKGVQASIVVAGIGGT